MSLCLMKGFRRPYSMLSFRLLLSSLVPVGKAPSSPAHGDPMVTFEYKLSKEGNQHSKYILVGFFVQLKQAS